MYPDLSYIVHAITGIGPDNGLSVVKTFGLLLILSFLASAFFFRLEIKRKEKEGLYKPTKEKIIIGAAASITDLVLNGLLGFVLGFKVVYIIQNWSEFQTDTAGVILSTKGNILAGLVGAAALAFFKYWDTNKKKLPKPKVQTVEIWPNQRVGDITVVAAISGIVGAKLFAMFESADHIRAFIQNPIGQLLSGSGLAIYGGLIVAFVVVLWYVRKKGMPGLVTMDAVAPALMVGYGVGRIGCQLSGDGDWGVVNTAPTPSWWFLPDSWWANSYPHNVLNQGVRLPDCEWIYCSELSPAVFPTPIYETIMAFAIVGILWILRTRIKTAGTLFFVYTILTGIERYFIEKIRVNPDIDFLGIQATQAEYISILLVVIGIAGIIWTVRRPQSTTSNPGS